MVRSWRPNERCPKHDVPMEKGQNGDGYPLAVCPKCEVEAIWYTALFSILFVVLALIAMLYFGRVT